MSVYDLDGETLSDIYNKVGTSLNNAYNKSGNVVFAKGQVIDYTNYSYMQIWASKGVGSTQGFAIYDGKVFWISKSGNSTIPANCYVWKLSDGSQALSSQPITVQTGHGNSIDMDSMTMYSATAYSGGNVYISSFSNDFLTNTLTKTLALPTSSDNTTAHGCDACLDETDKSILWSIHHTVALTDRDTPWEIRKWDLDNLTDNGDGTYTPQCLQTVSVAQPSNSPYFQGCAFHDGIFWYANGYSDSSGAYVFGVNPNTGEYLYTIDCETTTEPEGVYWLADENVDGGYALYVGFYGMMLRKYTFSYAS